MDTVIEKEKMDKEQVTEEEQNEKPYVFRTLSSADIFPMFKIISLIGVNEFTACFEKETMQKLIASMSGKKEEITSIVGISAMLEIANVIFANLPKCENYIYQFLSQTSNLSIDEIKGLDMVTFTEMIVDLIKKEEFKGFIGAVSRLFK